MNRTSKVTRALLVAALGAGLSACSGGSIAPGPSGTPAVATVTVTASPSAVASATLSPSASASPSPSSSPSASADALGTASPSPSVPGGRGVDTTVSGQIALRGVDAITVTSESDQEVKALLLPFTVVRDARGLVCDGGAAPNSCSVEELQKAIKKGGVLFAKVTIKDGVAVQIEDIGEK